jgi:hypothetical protein
MSDDIVERLREYAEEWQLDRSMVDRAADKIIHLCALIEASVVLAQPGALTVNCVRGSITCQEAERLRARVEVLEKHLGLMIANNLTGSCESEGMATDRAIAVLPDWLEKANGYTRLQLDAADEIVQLQVEKAKP